MTTGDQPCGEAVMERDGVEGGRGEGPGVIKCPGANVG